MSPLPTSLAIDKLFPHVTIALFPAVALARAHADAAVATVGQTSPNACSSI